MAISISKYAKERARELGKQEKPEGPVVTISRQFGCPSKPIAEKLISLINKDSQKKWKVVSKEILKEAATELGVPESDLKYFFKYNEQGLLDGMLSTINKFYVSDIRAAKAVSKAISSIAATGNSVIIGRGGAAICGNMDHSLHIRLTAPLEWRLAKIMITYDMRQKEALKFLKEYDQKRLGFLLQFSKEKDPANLFDIYFNCSRFDRNDIAKAIFNIMKLKKFI